MMTIEQIRSFCEHTAKFNYEEFLKYNGKGLGDFHLGAYTTLCLILRDCLHASDKLFEMRVQGCADVDRMNIIFNELKRGIQNGRKEKLDSRSH